MEKPHTGLDECPRFLLSCFRAKKSDLLLLPLGAPELLRLDVCHGEHPACVPEGEGHVARGHAVERDGDDVRGQHDEHVVAEK